MPQAFAATNALGLDTSLNLLTFGDFSVPSSDVQGRVAVGGNANLTQYSINTVDGVNALYDGVGLTVGGNLTFGSGQIFGNTLIGGNLSTSQGSSFAGDVQVAHNFSANNNWVTAKSLSYRGVATGVRDTFPVATTAPVSLGIDFASEQTRLTNLSQSFDKLVNTGNGYTNGYIGEANFVLDAQGASLAVFDLTASDVLKNLSFSNLAADTTVLINVHGQTVDFGQHGYDGFATGRVLFNLPEASQVTFASSVDASFLAPMASFSASGLITGQVVVAHWSGAGQVNDAAFVGQIGQVTPVPEPSEYALMLAGLGIMGLFARQSRRHNALAVLA